MPRNRGGGLAGFQATGIRFWTLVVATAVVLVACDPAPRLDDIGVQGRDSSVIEVIYQACAYDPVASVELWTANGPVVGDSDDEVLWRISATDGISQDSFVVGVTPPGFVEQIQLPADGPPQGELAVVVTSQRRIESIVGFQLSDLRERQVFTPGRYLSEAEFRAESSGDCSAG